MKEFLINLNLIDCIIGIGLIVFFVACFFIDRKIKIKETEFRSRKFKDYESGDFL